MFSNWYWGRFAPPFLSWAFFPGEIVLDFDNLDVNAAIAHLKKTPELSDEEMRSALNSAYERIAANERQLQLTQATLVRIEKLLRRLG